MVHRFKLWVTDSSDSKTRLKLEKKSQTCLFSCHCADTKQAQRGSGDMDRSACLLTDTSVQTKHIRQPNKCLTCGANRLHSARLSRHMWRYLSERERGGERGGVNDRMSEKSKEGM